MFSSHDFSEPEDNTLYELLNVSRTASDQEIKKVRTCAGRSSRPKPSKPPTISELP